MCQTNKDAMGGRPRRPYRLSERGLASLRETVQTVRPWQWSTGPRTPAGKARVARNALKHGERTVEAIARGRELSGLLRLLKRPDGAELLAAKAGDADGWIAATARRIVELWGMP